MQGSTVIVIPRVNVCSGINEDLRALFIGYIMKGCTTIVLPRVNVCAASDEGLGERFVSYEEKCLQ